MPPSENFYGSVNISYQNFVVRKFFIRLYFEDLLSVTKVKVLELKFLFSVDAFECTKSQQKCYVMLCKVFYHNNTTLG